ncbi:hypothetical protein AJ80_08685 [Polytolypa hystricis UAMH7299]|uniref:DNA repair metallo-beta-lactamase domain-containing protein n=1 Tax=Polytolypa hystricis (strain UAMH7299) TaxID=1447883 RepID=A0A2B7X3V5_POLH7|nr:hypothetical protein AJ80_08685 [Polytolypa hystricis UAMH7299]
MGSSSPYFNGSRGAGNSRTQPSRPATFPSKRAPVKRNTSILSFFKKTDTPPSVKASQRRITDLFGKQPTRGERGSGLTTDPSEGLFFDDGTARTEVVSTSEELSREGLRARSRSPEDGVWGNLGLQSFIGPADEERYNENAGGGQKRRKLSPSSTDENVHIPEDLVKSNEDRTSAPNSASNGRFSSQKIVSSSAPRRIGPFVDESDSEGEEDPPGNGNFGTYQAPTNPKPTSDTSIHGTGSSNSDISNSHTLSPVRSRSPVTNGSALDPLFDEVEEGMAVETEERLYYQESMELGVGIEDFEAESERDFAEELDSSDTGGIRLVEEDAVCPICRASLYGMTDTEASAHVNGCLDGNQAPAISENKVIESSSGTSVAINKLQRAAIPRPGQRNPFTLDSTTVKASAFSKLMAGNAEDSAWAAAATREVASKGKQAYERTCPFYKILPGFSICVDAFRYGAVEGCNAYFLSHFHSDHYVGLTSSWRHGPIYCSRVTGNLVRQQLKVDPKLIIDLEFEQTVEVPNTDDVRVTMIPANHCPGSSLFLFEKTVGKGTNPKVHRILHCGDFRACPAHVQHPLLRPDVLDLASGKTKQQRIDVCYLDTTYLNPKYAFPCQEDVVAACAEMCASLNKDQPDASDTWERGKAERTGKAMTSFLSKNGDLRTDLESGSRGKLLVVIGTYSIGKERICVGIARALKSKIYAPAPKQRICNCLEDPELSSLLTNDPLDAQVHMQTLVEIRAETLSDYLTSFRPRFSRIVGFRPTGWNYRPPAGRMTDNPPVSSVLNSEAWKPRFSVKDLVPQRGSNKESSCFGVPYSEHSSFRELTMFCCALRISRVIPTVNVGSQKSRERMKVWFEKWEAEKRKAGLFKVDDSATRW